ncbi:hypothetical protein G9A89_021662 [Geosiphon pyriformis]|nr:hypothetical protein G9A89_021662 [Geosiphon pyriformis]
MASQKKSKTSRKDVGFKGNEPITKDPRFVHLHQDPRFVRPKKKDMKVKLDQRFLHILNNKDFSDTPKVDKYGRRLSTEHTARELKRFYTLEDQEKLNSDDSNGPKGSSDEIDYNEKEKEMENVGKIYDLARGEGLVPSSSSSSDEDYEVNEENQSSANDEIEVMENLGKFEESEEDIPLGAETHRFAVVNLDWDNVKASDLMKVFSCFAPSRSIIHSVKIYPSDFGKERLELERREGPPKEIFKSSSSTTDYKDTDELNKHDGNINFSDNEASQDFDEEALRKYQIERLRYYFAVVDCDSVETARQIHQHCDGAELENTANFLDLQFIPDDMKFNDEPKDESYQAPDVYRPVDFVTDALQHSNVKLTWDNDDPERARITRSKFTKDELERMDFQAYLAVSEDSEEDIETARKKYKDLLNLTESKNSFDEFSDNQREEYQEMEVTFAPGLSEIATELLEKRKEKEAIENETTLDTYLRKQREKKKIKKETRNGMKTDESKPILSSEGDAELIKDKFSGSGSKKLKKSEAEWAEEEKSKAELELLVMDGDDDGHKHFDMKEILKKEKRKGKKKRLKKVDEDEEDTFEINVKDPRFAALHESYHFAIDPTNPQFKKTKAMKKLLEERRHRQTDLLQDDDLESTKSQNKILSIDDTLPEDTSLTKLIKSVKRKSTIAVEKSRRQGKRKKAD